jgi:hypothetical protein
MGLFFADFIGTLLPTLLLVFLFKQFLSYRNAILAANGALLVAGPFLSMWGHDYDHLDFSVAPPQVAVFIVMWLSYRYGLKTATAQA